MTTNATFLSSFPLALNQSSYYAGPVGLGIAANPSYMLSVAGLIYSTTGGFKFPDGTVQTSAAAGPPDYMTQSFGIT